MSFHLGFRLGTVPLPEIQFQMSSLLGSLWLPPLHSEEKEEEELKGNEKPDKACNTKHCLDQMGLVDPGYMYCNDS